MAGKPDLLPKESLVKIAIIVGVLAVVGYLGIFLTSQSAAKLNAKIIEKQVEIEVQKNLYPVYLKFKSQADEKVVKELPLIDIQRLSQEKVDEVVKSIETTASGQGLAVNAVVPDPTSLEEDPSQVLVRCEFFARNDQGKRGFANIRGFLVKLGGLPFVKHIEDVVLREGQDGVGFKMRLRLAVASST